MGLPNNINLIEIIAPGVCLLHCSQGEVKQKAVNYIIYFKTYVIFPW